jgi:hypothetical protein
LVCLKIKAKKAENQTVRYHELFDYIGYQTKLARPSNFIGFDWITIRPRLD